MASSGVFEAVFAGGAELAERTEPPSVLAEAEARNARAGTLQERR